MTEPVTAGVAYPGRDLTGRSETRYGVDTTQTDLAMMRSALGPVLAHHGLTLNGRADIEHVLHVLTHQFGL